MIEDLSEVELLSGEVLVTSPEEIEDYLDLAIEALGLKEALASHLIWFLKSKKSLLRKVKESLRSGTLTRQRSPMMT